MELTNIQISLLKSIMKILKKQNVLVAESVLYEALKEIKRKSIIV